MNNHIRKIQGVLLRMKTIPHNKPTIGDEEIKAVVDVMSNLQLTTGIKVKEFEMLFSKYIGTNVISASSGTTALHLALMAIDISKNDEVILPSYTCITVALPVLYQQAKPILTDINNNYNISVEDIKRKITDKTKAVIVPHMFGYPADLDEIKELCKEKDIYLVEDCAQSIGALYHDKEVGTFGDISIFSFYATKMMTSIQGGMVCTNNSDWISIIKDLRHHDQCRSFEDTDPRIKYSYMMSDVGAAVGIAQLKKLGNFIKSRRKIASIYREKLSDEVIHPIESSKKRHVYSRYVVKIPYLSLAIIEKLRERNIICEIMHMPPLHRRALLKKFNRDVEFPKTDEIINFTVSLPIYPSLKDEEAMYVADSFNKAMEGMK